MKLLIVINSLAIGGAERLIVDTVPRYIESGLKVELLLLGAIDNSMENELISNDIVVKNLQVLNYYNPLIIFKVRKYLRDFDLVHVHLFPSLYLLALAKATLFSRKIKLVYSEHSTSNKRRGKLLFRFTDRLVYSFYDKIVAISSEVKEKLISHLGDNNKIVVIENGTNLNRFHNDTMPSKKLRKQEEYTLIQIARLTPEKDYETLLKAIPLLNKKIKLLVVGIGPLESKLKQLTEELKISNKVIFLGLRHDIPELLSKSDLAILSSHHEGLSIAVLEKMASGIPVIASDVPGLNSLISNSGVLFHHRDYEDLAKKIDLILEDRDFYENVAQRCKERSKEFSIEKMVSSHLRLYKELCKNPN